MKGLKALISWESVDYTEPSTRIQVEVISEPYPVISTSRAFHRGESWASVSSQTCVVCKADDGRLIPDIPVVDLELMETDNAS